ncbi:MAG: hypothetical protein AB7S26_05370 [Sandaracinaceae bacterium]
MTRKIVPLVAMLLTLGLVLGAASDASAQRRRRGRRGSSSAQTQTQTPDAGTEEEPVPDEDPFASPAPNAGTPNPNAAGTTGARPLPNAAGTAPASGGVRPATGAAGAPAMGTAGGGPGAQIEDGEDVPGGGEPSEQPTAEYDPGPAPPDISPIRADYVALMDDLVQARMRVHALGSELFRTRITVDVEDRTGDRVTIARIVVRLDGAPVYQRDGPIEGGSDGARLFEGALAPGPHVLRLELEQRQRENDAYRYTLEESFRFQVVRERLNEVTLVLEDGSDMASSFPSGGEGRYEVRTRMRVAARNLPN